MADIKISQITPVATTLADSDMLPGSKSGGGSERFTGALLKSEILDSVDNLSALTTLTDAMKTHIIDASGDSKSSTLAVASNYFRDSNKPSYKNIVIKNNSGSPTDTIDVDFDELQIGILREESYTPQSITLSSNLDTGSPATDTWYYIYARTGIGQTTICQFSTSATTPAVLAGYTESRCIGPVYNDGSGDFKIFSQIDNDILYTSHQTSVILNSGLVTVDLSSRIPPAKVRAIGSYSIAGNKGGVQTLIDVNVNGYINGSYIFQNRLRSEGVFLLDTYNSVSGYLEFITTNQNVQFDLTGNTASLDNFVGFYFLSGFRIEI